MHKADIKALIEKRGKTVTGLSVELGFRPGTISNCFTVGSYPVETALAKFLNVPPQTLFPKRYTSDGQRLHPSVIKENSRKSDPDASQGIRSGAIQ